MTVSPRENERWLPVDVLAAPRMMSVRWVELGTKALTEPFFHQTLRKLRASDPPARRRMTDLGTLIEVAGQSSPIIPSGLIFHVSRCGSTLLANALRNDESAVVVSEARSFGKLFRPRLLLNSPFPVEGRYSGAKMLLDCFATIYAHTVNARDPKLILKCHTMTMLTIRWVRLIWPDVPFLVLIRDPVEVIVSNLKKHAGWVRTKRNSVFASAVFGLSGREISGMSLAEFCAMALGKFCESAARVVGDRCRVLDYQDLNEEAIYSVAKYFGLTLPSGDTARVADTLGIYSKDVNGKRRFEDDRERKQNEATSDIRRYVTRWAENEYRKLRESMDW